MEQPKYQIGDRVPNSLFVIRGIAPQKNGDYLYFVQTIEADNCFVATHQDIIDCVTYLFQEVDQLMKDKLSPDEYRLWNGDRNSKH